MPLIPTRPNLALYIAVFLMLALAAFGPIAQLSDYPHFADQRSLFGIPNAGDVLSNVGFLLVAVYGLLQWDRAGVAQIGHTAYGVFFAAFALTAAGSVWYHLAPDDTRLVWDRLPIALACAALLSAELQRALPAAGWALRSLLPLCAFGAAGVAWWHFTGDLRPYLMIQAAPLLLIPALHWQARSAMGRRTAFVLAIVLYVVAKMFEVADAGALSALGLVSGHTMKHLLAAAAGLILVWQFSRWKLHALDCTSPRAHA